MAPKPLRDTPQRRRSIHNSLRTYSRIMTRTAPLPLEPLDCSSIRRIAVINPKGGCGKTTLATNLASRYAGMGCGTALFDYDPLGAAMRWLQARSDELPTIHGVAAHRAPRGGTTRAWQMRVPHDTGRIVIDTPAGIERLQLTERLRDIDVVLIPVLPSPIDMAATADFVHDLFHLEKQWSGRTRIGAVTNRVKPRSRAFDALEQFLRSLGIPVVGHVPDSQRYINAAQQGMGGHELPRGEGGKEVACWSGIVEWIEGEIAALADSCSGPNEPRGHQPHSHSRPL